MTALLELAARCEAATGPDRELDCAIRLAVYAPEGATMEQSPINGAWCIYSGTGFRSGKPALWESNEGRNLAFTASLDAAMTLVPEGWNPVEILMDAINDNCEGDWLAALPRYACAAALRARTHTSTAAVGSASIHKPYGPAPTASDRTGIASGKAE